MTYHPVVRLPERVDVLDLSGSHGQGGRPRRRRSPYSIGGYDEDRRAVYPPWFAGRTLHVGVDVGAPAGTEVFAFDDGVVVHRGYVAGVGDYGFALVTEHVVDGAPLWVFLGHLSASVGRWRKGERFERGAVLGHLGAPHENGGWPPHVHVQLCVERPETVDVRGVWHVRDRARALALHPDPARIGVGPW